MEYISSVKVYMTSNLTDLDYKLIWTSFVVFLLSSASILDVGGYFESGTLVRYDLMSESSSSPAVKEGDSGFLSSVGNLTREELSFSFSTSHTPAVLIYISSKTQDYLAVVLRQNGETVLLFKAQNT